MTEDPLCDLGRRCAGAPFSLPHFGQRDAGTPWRSRDALDAIAILDTPAWASLLGLLSECPVIPEMLTATLDSRTGAISATTFDFISTASQIGRVQEFMARLPDTLRP